MSDLNEIKRDRQAIYGDPRENHEGIAAAWAGLLQPWWVEIAEGTPVPPHVVALLMAALKMNRMRRVYHADNFDDIRVYLEFAEKWQKENPAYAKSIMKQYGTGRPEECVRRRRVASKNTPYQIRNVYVAGPYSAPTPEEVTANVSRAVIAAAEVMARGHRAHCPHAATHPVEHAGKGQFGYEDWMDLDFSIIEAWATDILVIGDSPGTRREVEYAERLGLRVLRDVSQLPDLKPLGLGIEAAETKTEAS